MNHTTKKCNTCGISQGLDNFASENSNDAREFKSCLKCRKANLLRIQMMNEISYCCVCETKGGRLMKGKFTHNNKLYCANHKNIGIREELLNDNKLLCSGFNCICINIIEPNKNIYCDDCLRKKKIRNS